MALFMVLFSVLLLAWLIAAGVFHAAGVMVHVFLALAIVFFILHCVSQRRGAV